MWQCRSALKVLDQLITNGFVEMDAWNDCPGVAQVFLPFLRRHPSFTAHGYAVSWERGDTRITVEGIEKAHTLAKDEINDFTSTFNGADEIQLTDNYARCWYD